MKAKFIKFVFFCVILALMSVFNGMAQKKKIAMVVHNDVVATGYAAGVQTYDEASAARFMLAFAGYEVEYISAGTATGGVTDETAEQLLAKYAEFDLIVLHPTLGGQNNHLMALKQLVGKKPILNLKAFCYQGSADATAAVGSGNRRWGWANPNPGNAGALDNVFIKVAPTAKDHPIFVGIPLRGEGNNELRMYSTETLPAANSLNKVNDLPFQGIDWNSEWNASNYLLATHPDGSTNCTQMHEINLNDAAKYIFIGISTEGNAFEKLSDEAIKLLKNTVAYLLIKPVPKKKVAMVVHNDVVETGYAATVQTYDEASAARFMSAFANCEVEYISAGTVTGGLSGETAEQLLAKYAEFDLIVLHPTLGGQNNHLMALKQLVGKKPILNLKAFCYQGSGSATDAVGSGNRRWGWVKPNPANSGTTEKVFIKVAPTVKNHPVFAGITLGGEGSDQLSMYSTTTLPAANSLNKFNDLPFKGIDWNSEWNASNYLLATHPDEGTDATQMHEINVNSAAKYILIGISTEGNGFEKLSDDAIQLLKNTVDYLTNPKEYYDFENNKSAIVKRKMALVVDNVASSDDPGYFPGGAGHTLAGYQNFLSVFEDYYTITPMYDVSKTSYADVSEMYSDFDLIVIHPSIGGANAHLNALRLLVGEKPILNLKAFTYRNASRWGWTSASEYNSGFTLGVPHVTVPLDVQTHPIFKGMSYLVNSETSNRTSLSLFDIDTEDPNAQFILNAVDPLPFNGNNWTAEMSAKNNLLATWVNMSNRTFMHELNMDPAGKYMLIGIATENGSMERLSDNAKALLLNTANYLSDTNIYYDYVTGSMAEVVPPSGWDYFEDFEGLQVTKGANGSRTFTRDGVNVGITERVRINTHQENDENYAPNGFIDIVEGALATNGTGSGNRGTWYWPTMFRPISFAQKMEFTFDVKFGPHTGAAGAREESQVWFFSTDNEDIKPYDNSGWNAVGNTDNHPLFMINVFGGGNTQDLGVSLPVNVDRGFANNNSDGISPYTSGDGARFAFEYAPEASKQKYTPGVNVTDVWWKVHVVIDKLAKTATFNLTSVEAGAETEIVLPLPDEYYAAGFRGILMNGTRTSGNISACNIAVDNIGVKNLDPANMKTFTVNFVSNVASIADPKERTIFEGASVGVLPVLERRGWTFDGWFDETFATEYTATFAPTANVTMYAKWTDLGITFELSFDPGEGVNVPDSKEVVKGYEIGALPSVIKEGFSFVGWFTEGGIQYTSTTVFELNADLILYAEWKELGDWDYFEDFGNITSTQGAAPVRSIFWRTGERIGHSENGGTAGDAGLVHADGYYHQTAAGTGMRGGWFFPQIDPIQFILNMKFEFDVWFGAFTSGTQTDVRGPEEQQLWFMSTDNSDISFPAGSSWPRIRNTDNHALFMISSFGYNTTDLGIALPVNVERHYGDNAGNGVCLFNPAPESTTGPGGGDAARYFYATTPAAHKHLFKPGITVTEKWWTVSVVIERNVNMEGTATFVLKSKDGEFESDPIVIPLPDEYMATSFRGMFLHGSRVSGGTNNLQIRLDNVGVKNIDPDVDFRIISFNSQTEDIDNPRRKTVVAAEEIGTLPVLARIGYSFDGWFTEPNGGGVKVDAATIYSFDGHITLYAKWGDTDVYTLSFVSGYEGFENPEAKRVTYGLEVGQLPSFPRRSDGYVFRGWFTEPDGEGNRYTQNTILEVKEDVTLNASWVYVGDWDYIEEFTNPNDVQRVANFTIPGVAKRGEFAVMEDMEVEGNWFWYFIASGANPFAELFAIPEAVAFEKELIVEMDFASTTAGGNNANEGEIWFLGENEDGSASTLFTIFLGDGASNSVAGFSTGKPNFDIKAESSSGAGDAVSGNKRYWADIPGQYKGQLEEFTFSSGGGTSWIESVWYHVRAEINKELKRVNITITGITDEDYVYSLYFPLSDDFSATNFKSIMFNVARSPDPGWQIRFDNLKAKADRNEFQSEPGEVILSFNSNAIFNNETLRIESPNAKVVTTGQTVGELEEIFRVGYTLKEWNTEANGTGTVYTAATVAAAVNTVLYAIWVPNVHIITFDTNGEGGSVNIETISVTYDAEIGELPVPVRDGFHFYGWNFAADGSGSMYRANTLYQVNVSDEDLGRNVSTDATLFAIWAPIYDSFILSYEPNTGGVTGLPEIPSKVVIYNTQLGEYSYAIPVISKEGYIFAGWYLDGRLDKIIGSSMFPIGGGDITLNAKWVAIPTVDYAGYDYIDDFETADYNNNGSVTKGTTFGGAQLEATTVGTSSFGLSRETKDGEVINTYFVHDVPGQSGQRQYQFNLLNNRIPFVDNLIVEFDFWSSAFSGHAGGGTTDAERAEGQVWFLDNNNNPAFTLIVPRGSNQLGVMAWNPKNEDDGTSKFGFTEKGNTTFANEHVFTGAPDAHKGLLTDATSSTWYHVKVQISKSQKLLHFTIWNNSYYDELIMVLPDDYAAENISVLYFNSKRGSGQNNTWQTRIDNIGINGKATAMEPQILMSFDANAWRAVEGGTGMERVPGISNPNSISLSPGAAVETLPVVVRTDGGFMLKEWNTKADGTGLKIGVGHVFETVENVTLYAIWGEQEGIHYLSFDSNAENVPNPGNRQVQEGRPVNTYGNLPAPALPNTLQREGYDFVEWNTAANGSGTTYTNTMLFPATTDVTLYAQWTGKTYNLKFNPMVTGIVFPDLPVTYGQAIGEGKLPVPTRANYVFDGWFTAATGGVQYTAATVYNVLGDTPLFGQWTALSVTGELVAEWANLKLFPNPASSLVTISGLEGGELISIFDLSGRLVINTKATADKTNISVTNLTSGTYFVRITKDNAEKTVKLLVE